MLDIKSIYIFILLILNYCITLAQYAPQAPLSGHKGVAANDKNIVGWATGCTVERGWLNIADKNLGKVSFGMEQNAIGSPSSSVVSLGDSGIAILTFEYPLKNGEGADFAVFENGFADPMNDTLAFLELAFVEVSSDGENYFRFPASCMFQDSVQIDNFTFSDATLIHNLAGKYKNGFGTPFDLEELKDESELDVNNITHIRIVDAIGSIDDSFASFDKEGKKINDPYPTAFPSGGFDLKAIAVLHDNRPENPNNITENISDALFQIYPNPFQNNIVIATHLDKDCTVKIWDILGKTIFTDTFSKQKNINTQHIAPGIYIVQIVDNYNNSTHFKIVKK